MCIYIYIYIHRCIYTSIYIVFMLAGDSDGKVMRIHYNYI